MSVTQDPVPLPSEEPRHCPACGARVAAKAKTCLMCGASLAEEAATATEKATRSGLPGWARAMTVVALALAILAAGGFGLYTILTAEPERVTPTAIPTRTPTPTLTPTPTPTSTPTPTPTPIPPLVHQVQPGETLLAIAISYDTTVEAILALNPDVDAELIQVGQLLLIPVPTPTPGPTHTPAPGEPTPTPAEYTIHLVLPGETLISIAEKYGVSVTLLRTANNLSPDDDTIQVNQSLVIPLGTPLPSPTPTVDPNATPTPLPPYPAPALLSPPEGAIVVGDAAPILQWASVSVLRGDEWYELVLFQLPEGVISATVRTRATAWHMPPELLSTSGTGEFRWQVQVVREAGERDGQPVYEAAGTRSQVRTFTWRVPTPTPTDTPTVGPTGTPTG